MSHETRPAEEIAAPRRTDSKCLNTTPPLSDRPAATDKVTAALTLAAKGLRVFPLKPNEKRPAILDWTKTATTDEVQIRKWWAKAPDANIGVLASDLLVLDLDVKGGKDGLKVIDQLSLEGDVLPVTFTVKTPTGGEHRYFRTTVTVANGVDVLGPGVDVRGLNGYVVGHGSTIDGKAYRTTHTRPLEDAPQWLVDRCGKAKPKKAAGMATEPPSSIDQDAARRRVCEYLAGEAPLAIEGAGGDDTAYRVACRVKDLGVSLDDCVDLMLKHWNPRCEPPWEPEGLRRKVGNAYQYGTEDTGAAAPEVEFSQHPADAFADLATWREADLRWNAIEMVRLRRSNPARYDQVFDLLILFGVVDDRRALESLIADAELWEQSGVDVLAVLEDSSAFHSDAVAERLAGLAKSAPEVLERLRERLTAGSTPLVKKRAFAARIKRGEALAIERAAEEDALASGKVRVFYDPANLPDLCDEIESALLADYQPGRERVFSYGGAYVSVRERPPTLVTQIGNKTYPAQPLVSRYDMPSLRERTMRSVQIVAKGGGEPIKCPEDIVQTLLSRRGGSAPPLVGLVEAPTMRRDGSILDARGYDDATGLFAWFDPSSFKPVSEWPDPGAALRYLREQLLAEFEFKEAIDRDVAIVALITGLLRRTLPESPGFAFIAPQQSSGKTALANAICAAAFGRPAAAVGWPRSDEEMGKTLLGLLQQGQSAVVFDNVRDGSTLASTELARAMTSGTYGGRLLGLNDVPEFPTGVLWVVNGNNLQISEDLTTRFLDCCLHPSQERPDQRRFSRDLDAWVAENRAEVVAAGLAIPRAYAARGKPPVAMKPSRFREWDSAVRAPLIHAGGEDVGRKFDAANNADPALGAHRALLRNWPILFGERWVRVKEVTTVAQYPEGVAAEAFSEALRELMTMRGKPDLSHKAVANCLQQWKGRTAGGLRLLDRRDRHEEVTVWRVVAVAAEGAEE